MQTPSKTGKNASSFTDDKQFFLNEQLREIARSNSQTESEKIKQAVEWEENQKIYHRRRKEYDEEVLQK